MTKEEAKSAAAGYRLEVRAVKNGDESDRVLLTAGAEDVCRAYDINSDPEKGWYAVADIKDGVDRGTYCFHYMKGNEEVGRSVNVTFYGTEELNILVLPVKGYWSRSCNYDPDKGGGAPTDGCVSDVTTMQYSDRDGAKRDWTTLCDSLRSYLLDVYPTANIRVDEGRLLDAGDAEYDMASSDEGRKRLWQEACKRQSKLKNGKDKYDLILAFVSYRQEDGTRRGYTFGRPATSDIKKAGKQPKIVVKLREASATGRASEQPRVKWSDKAKEDKKTVTKDFAIVKAKLGSDAVSFVTNSNTVSENVVKSPDKTKTVGI